MEKDLENKFRLAVKKVGGKAYKFVSPGNSGVPDRLVILPGGKVGFVELKQEGKKPTGLQRKQIHDLLSKGHYANVLDRESDIQGVIDQIRHFRPEQANMYVASLEKRFWPKERQWEKEGDADEIPTA